MNTTFFCSNIIVVVYQSIQVFFVHLGSTADDAFSDRKRQEKEGRLDGV
jgi:hypothetical protein